MPDCQKVIYVEHNRPFDPVGQITQKELSNGAVTTQTFDEVGNVTGITNTAPGPTLVSQLGYTYDNVNNRLTQSNFDGTYTTLTTWTYDPTNQISSEHASGVVSSYVTHTYDAANNRTVQNSSGVLTTYTLSPGNRLQLMMEPGIESGARAGEEKTRSARRIRGHRNGPMPRLTVER